MSVADFIKDRIFMLMLQVSGMAALAVFLHATGYPKGYCILILICQGLAVFLWAVCQYIQRSRYFAQVSRILEQTDQTYLLGELMPVSFRLEDQLYQQLMRRSNQAVIEKIRRIEDEKTEYREYIESWVHEIKAPIMSISLICEQQKDDRMRRILMENGKVENYADMALYYARSDEVYKDYLIRETKLQQTAEEALLKNKYYLIQNRIEASADCTHTVFTDVKWIFFILNQLILNAAKYRCEVRPRIRIYTEQDMHGVSLVVADNGMGICEQDLPRIFEKGFTGANGRKQERATGMGLYLCKKLCTKMGIKILAESWEGAGTKMILWFPVSTYMWKLE